ncbi:hypothetical protein ACQK1D_001397 [Escherichia coli]
MANLPETPQWEDGIYQIEVSDPVLGGPDGISNRQGKQLASRTLYLKQQVEKGGSDLEKHIAAADPHTQYAPKASPTFTGTPTAPTQAKTDNSTKLATTAHVKSVVADYAPLSSPTFTGTPTAPTQAKTDNSTKLATTAHVKSVVADYAPLSSPALTGKPTAPTAAQTANDTQLANTAFVKAAIAALVASSPEALDTLNELAAALGNDPNFATTMTNALAGKQPLDKTLTALSGKSVAALLEYLQLGEGAKLGAASCVTGATGYLTIPVIIAGQERSLIMQWFGTSIPDFASTVTVNFPIAFPNECMIPLFSDVSTLPTDLGSTVSGNLAVGRTYYTAMTRTQITCAGYGGFRVFVIGW